ncbi:MAG: hypothetical protein HY908_36110 [Myxococcales bacterium]|nr:hypothetical protein [Myxococcales bacterium]
MRTELRRCRRRPPAAYSGSGSFALALAVGCAGGCSCDAGDYGPRQPSAIGSGHPLPPWEGGAGGAGAGGADAGIDLSDRCIPAALSAWDPKYDSCWKSVQWPSPCKILVAEQPALAVPPLEWLPCEWHDGCQRMKLNWDAPLDLGNAILVPKVARAADGYRLGLMLSWAEGPGGFPILRAAVYDGAGTPVAVWRSGDSDPMCIPQPPIPAKEHVWFGASSATTGKAAYVVAEYGAVAAATEVVPLDWMNQLARANDDTLTLWAPSGNFSLFYDRISGAHAIAGNMADHFQDFSPARRSAVGVCFFGNVLVPKGCMWNGQTGTVAELVGGTDFAVPRFDSDGQTLVWIQAGTEENLDTGAWPDPWLYTSPYATTPAGVVPQKRRPAPPFSYCTSAAGDGYYATCALDEQYHLYRLSDARHWAYPFAAMKPYVGSGLDVLFIDATEVWFQTGLSVVRQRLDALGAGD